MIRRSVLRAVGAAAVFALASCLTPGEAQQSDRLSVVSFNIGDATGVVPPIGSVVQVLADLGWRDVYLLQEVLTADSARALSEGVTASGGGRYFLAYSPALRVAVLSRQALSAQATFVAPSSPLGRGALLVRSSAGGRPVCLVDVHLDPIPKSRDPSGRVDMGLGGAIATVFREMYGATPRSRSTAEILDWLDTACDGAQAIVAGDFNTVPSSAAVRLMTGRFVDAAAASGHSAGTYRRVRLPLRPRVDYIFVSPGIDVLYAARAKKTAGDHYPVVAELLLR